MHTPLAWMALGTVIGAISWLWLAVSPPLLVVLATIGLIGVASRRKRLPVLGLILLGTSMGQTAVTVQVPPGSLPAVVVAEVMYARGQSAMIETARGKLWAHFGETPPQAGTWISAQVRRAVDAPVLPGGWLPDARVKLARATKVRVGHWIQAQPQPTQQALPSWLHHGPTITALATGDRSGLSPDTQSRFRRTGTIHLLAISGLHVGMVAGMGAAVGWLLSRALTRGPKAVLGRWCTSLMAVGAALFYGSIVHWPVSTQRAAWMVVFVAVCTLSGRKVDPWQTLGIAALAVVLIQPEQVASLGFLLSFMAVAALIGWMPLATGWLRRSHPWPLRWCIRSLAATLIATFGTLPIIAWVFQELAPLAPLANLVAVPLFAGLVVPAALLGVHGPSMSSDFFLWIADSATSVAMAWLGVVDVGTISIAVGHFGAVLLCVAIACFRRPGLAALCVILALTPKPTPKGDLEITFPAVGQGSCALIRWPDGRHWLVDGGPPSKRLLHWLRRRGVHTLDAVFLSHPDLDHFGGLSPVIDALNIGTLWVSRRPTEDEHYFRALWLRAHQRGIPSRVFGRGGGHAGTDNDNGLVFTLRHGANRFLLLGDVGAEVETRLAKNMPTVDVVLVSHHGSKTASSPALIAAAQAKFAVVQSGLDNRFGHPHPAVIQAWGPKNLLRTDTLGSITTRSDGYGLTITRWHQKTPWASVTLPSSDIH